MSTTTRHAFIARHAHVLSVLAGMLFFVVAAFTTTYTVFQKNLDTQKNAQRSLSKRAQQIDTSVERLLELLSQQPDLACNEASLSDIRASLLQYRFVRDVGLYDEFGRLACTTRLGLLKPTLNDPPNGLHSKFGHVIWPSIPVLQGNGKIETMVIRFGRFNIMLDPFAIADILDASIDNIWFKDANGSNSLLTSSQYVDDSMLNSLSASESMHLKFSGGRVFVTMPIENTSYVFQTSRSMRDLADMASIEVTLFLALSGLLAIAIISVLTPRLLAYNNLEKYIAELCGESNVRCVYQPIIDLKTGAVTGCEVLMRLQDSQRMIYPDEAIPAIIAKGLTWQLDRSVSDKAFREISAHLPVTKGFKLAFNFFAADIQYDRLAPHLHGLFKASQRSDLKINIEITEYAYTDAMVSELRRFENDGFLVSVDDFGTGYSNLGMVKKLHPDFLKIDKSFVFEMEESSIRSSLIPEIIAIASAVKAEVIAEGVENAAQAERLAQMGVQYAQGFHFARPMPIEEFVTYYLNQQRLAALDVRPG